MPDQSEQGLRSSVRFPLKLPVEVKTESAQDLTAETANISSGGVLFHVDADMAVGSAIEFSISMPASVLGTERDVRVRCAGRVVRCSVEGEKRAVAAIIDDYSFETGANA